MSSSILLKSFVISLICVLGMFLPFHGLITTMTPDFFRFYKEIVLILCLGCVVFLEIWNFWKSSWQSLSTPEKWAGLFLVWGGGLVAINPDWYHSVIAFRYLGTGFLIFLIFSRLIQYWGSEWGRKALKQFSICFVTSCVGAVIFGTWMKYGGGFEVMTHFYSSTISSWVPGQMIPIYHQVGDFIRMQGGSSGPIVFGHLLLLSLFLHFFVVRKKLRNAECGMRNYLEFGICNLGSPLCLLFGILQSGSRAAVLALIVGVVIWLGSQKEVWKWGKTWCGKMIIILVVGVGLLGLANFQKELLLRAGTSDHFTRPIEAFQKALESPIMGNLGELGPAARAKNLTQNNDDKALIAENVFVDYFAQMGIFGFILAVGFFVSVFLRLPKEYWPFIGGFLVVVNLATIFDMVPLAMVVFLVLAFLSRYKFS